MDSEQGMCLQGLARNALWLLGGNLLAQALGAATGLVLARWAGPYGYGLYATAFSLALAFTHAALMGLDSVVPAEVARTPDQSGRVIGSALASALLWFPALILLILGIGKVLRYSADILALLLPAAFLVGLKGLVNLFRSALRGRERMDLDAGVQALEQGAALFGVGAALFLTLSVEAAIWAMVGAEVLALALAGIWARTLAWPWNWDLHWARKMVAAAFPLGLTFTLVGINLRLDVLVLSLFQPAQEVGLYNAAASLVMLSRSVGLVAAAFLPRLSALAGRDEREFARLRDQGLLWMLVPGIGLGVALSLVAPFLLAFLYGPSFLPAAPILRVLGFGSIAMFLNTYFWQVLIARGQGKIIASTTVGALLLSLAYALAFVPRWGAIGAAGAMVVREWSQTLWLTRRVLHAPPFTLRKSVWMPFLGAAAGMALTLWPVREMTGSVVLVYLGLAVILYLFVLMVGGRRVLRVLGLLVPLGMSILLARPMSVYAQTGIPVFRVVQSDMDGDHVPDLAVVDCAFASSRDRILIVDRAGNMEMGSDVLQVADFRDDVWIFDVGADGTAQLVLMFAQEGENRVAYLYDDRDGDGQVSYRARPRFVQVTESPYWHVRVVARSDWFLPDGRVNPALVFHIDGYILRYLEWGEAVVAPEWARREATTDGRADWEIEIADTDKDGIADYQLQRLLASSPPDVNLFRSVLYVNGRPRRPEPYADAIFWPLLVGKHFYEAYNYFDRPPVVSVDWVRAQIDRVGILGYPTEQGYHINSWVPWRKGEVNYANFENPMAYYDLARDADGRPELMVRMEVFAAHDAAFSQKAAFPGKFPRPIVQVDYSWDQNNDGRWDYEVSLANFYPITETVSFPDFAIQTVPYDQIPDWVMGREWAIATFVAMENGGYWSSEGMRDWNVNQGFRDGQWVEPSGLRDHYLTGLIERPPLENYTDIRRGGRGEYATEPVGYPALYWSPIDHRLHLWGAQGGVWNVDGQARVYYADRDRDGYLDQWQYVAADGRIQQLNVLPGLLLYAGDGEVALKQAKVELAAFSVSPPRNFDQWQALQRRLESLPAPVPADNLRGLLTRWEGPETRILGARVRDLRVTRRGVRFVLDLAPGVRVISREVEGFVPPSAPGVYRVTWEDGRWSVWPMTPATLQMVSLKVETTWEGETATVRALLRNSGLEDALQVSLCAQLEGPQDVQQVLTATLSVLPAEEEREILWGWRPAAAGIWKVSVMAHCEGEAAPVLLGATEVRVARRPPLYAHSFLVLSPRARAAVIGLLGAILLLAGGLAVVWSLEENRDDQG